MLPDDDSEPEPDPQSIFGDRKLRRVILNIVAVAAVKIVTLIVAKKLTEAVNDYTQSYSSKGRSS